MDKTHVQHAVGFVQHKDLHPVQADQPLAHQVQQAAGARDDDIRPLVQGFRLGALADPAEDDAAPERETPAVLLKVFPGLHGQLPGGRKDQRPDNPGVRTPGRLLQQALQNRQREGGGFAGAGLGAAQHVVPLQHQRDRGFLNRGRDGVSRVPDIGQQG